MSEYKVSLAAARVNANLSQKEAAKSMGISVNTLVNWESKVTEPKATQIRDLCRLYDVPIDFLCL